MASPSGALSARPNEQPTARNHTRQPDVPDFCVRPPEEVERVNEVTLSLSSDVTYTSPSPGLTVTALAPLSCTPVAQPASGLSTMQPLPSVAWVSVPVDGSRASATMALERAVAT